MALKGKFRHALDRMNGQIMYRRWSDACSDPQPAWVDLPEAARRAWLALAKQYTHDSVLDDDEDDVAPDAYLVGRPG